MKMRDELGTLFQDEMFAALFPKNGQPALAPWRLALVTMMQFAEKLSDRQAAHAVRARLDWKYALGLELEDRGFDFSVLSEFRARLIAGNAEYLLFETMLTCLKQRGLIKAGGRQRTDATHVLAAVRAKSSVVCVGETMRAALNVLAEVAPEWLRSFAPDEWYERVSRIGWRSIDFAIRAGQAHSACRNDRSRWIYAARRHLQHARTELAHSRSSCRDLTTRLGAAI
jgi:transposase